MLHIAFAGALANSIDVFQRISSRTDVFYYSLYDSSVNPAQLDLAVFLKNDAVGAGQVDHLASDAIPLKLGASWSSVPSETELDGAIQRSLAEAFGFIVGYSDKIHRVCRWLRMLTHPVGAAFQLPVHLTGETGTGKDLVARAIHQLSSLHNGTYVPLNLGAFPAELVASALFGHIKGAFTGALEDRKGAIRTAQNGVLFLDEIGETPLNAQVMLLRFLDRFEFQPIGSDATHEARLQLVTASNVDLQKLVQEGRFRADLLHRLCGLVLSLPPLRERRDDIPLLVRAFMKARGLSTDLSDEVMDFLKTREWPGNIRQLKACIDRFALVGSQSDLKEAVRMLEINEFNQQDHGDDLPLEDLRRDYDRRILTDRLRRFAGDTVATAESLGISRRSVYDLARRLEVDIQGSDKD